MDLTKSNNELAKALGFANKSQRNFVHNVGQRAKIQSNPLNNENGSVGKIGRNEPNDPVDSSDSRKRNPIGQEGNGVHAEGSKTTRPANDKDPVNTSTDDLTSKSEKGKSKGEEPKDMNKDSNGVREPHTELHNDTRKISDKPNGSAHSEQHITDIASGHTQHNTNDLKSIKKTLSALNQRLTKGLQISCGQINALNNHFENEFKSVQNSVNKHMSNAQRGGMFYNAEHSKGKKHTKEMADAYNAVTRCHHSHKSLTPNDWKAINAQTGAYMNYLADKADKSLDSKLVHDAQSGNKSALAKDNYEYDHKAHKSVNDSAAAPTSEAHKSLSLADCMSMMASFKKDGNSSAVASCASMCTSMKNSSADKNVTANTGNTSANISNLRVNSSSKVSKSSEDAQEPTKSIPKSNSTNKSMPKGKSIESTPDNKNEVVNKSVDNNNHADKSLNTQPLFKSIQNPKAVKNMGHLVISEIKSRGKHMIGGQRHVTKSLNMAKDAIKHDNYDKLMKSLTYFNNI